MKALETVFDQVVGFNGYERSQLFKNYCANIIEDTTLEFYVRRKSSEFLSSLREKEIFTTVAAIKAAVTCEDEEDIDYVRDAFFG